MNKVQIYPDKFNDEEIPQNIEAIRAAYFYLHGELERVSGYDCFDIVGELPSSGIHEAEVNWPDGTKTPSTLFVRVGKFTGGRLSGIAVSQDDSEGIDWAKIWYTTPGNFGLNY